MRPSRKAAAKRSISSCRSAPLRNRWRRRSARNDADLVDVADYLWNMAVQLEDGDLSDAERELRAAQERLRDAMERNAPQEEINRLAQELRQAMDRFLREFAERMQRDQQQADPNS